MESTYHVPTPKKPRTLPYESSRDDRSVVNSQPTGLNWTKLDSDWTGLNSSGLNLGIAL